MKGLVTVTLGFIIPFLIHAQSDSLLERNKWFHPDYAKIQFAGEIGFLSVGVGFKLFKKQNGELDLMAGYLPKPIGGDDIFTTAIKFAYLPWDKQVLNNQLTWQPLSLGAMLFHAWGERLNRIRDKELYPRGYYWWSPGTRFGPVFGTRLKRDFDKRSRIKSLSFYMEFVTNDLYIYSWGANTGIIPLSSIFDMSLGLRIDW